MPTTCCMKYAISLTMKGIIDCITYAVKNLQVGYKSKLMSMG